MPSLSTQPAAASTASTSLKPRTSSRRCAAPARSRNRFDVSLARPTGRALSVSRSARASLFRECCCGFWFVEEAPAQRIARHRHIALREYDLEEMRARARRAEHLGAAVQVHAPDAAEALVELARIEGVDLLPVAVEALGPRVERQRVMAAQVLDVDDLEAGFLHFHGDVGEARDPAAGEDVLADEVLGVEVADMADEMDHAETAGLERAGVRADQIHQAVAAGVFEAADGDHLVVLPVHAAEVALHRAGVLQPPELDLLARVLDLRARRVVARDLHPEMVLGKEQEPAEAAADVHHVVAGLEQHLLADVLELVALRLFEGARTFFPVRAGVEHQRIVEPEAVELGPERVVEFGVLLRAHPARVGVQELVHVVRYRDQELRRVGARRHAGGEGTRQAALEIDLAGKVGLEHSDMAEGGDAPVGAPLAEDERELGSALADLELRAVGEAHREVDARTAADLAEGPVEH